MSKSLDLLPPAMLESEMLELCKSDVVDDVPVYPEIEDRSKIKAGEFAIVTTTLVFEGPSQPSQSKTDYAVPAKASLVDEELFVTACDNELWSQGWRRPGPIKVTADVKLRGIRDGELDDANTRLLDSYDDIENMISRCHSILLENNRGYKRAMQLNGGVNDMRRDLLRETLRQMMGLTPNEWKDMRPAEVDKITKEELLGFHPFFDKAINVIGSDKIQAAPSIGNSDTNAKYVSLLMDMAASKYGPDPPQAAQGKEVRFEEPMTSSQEIAELRKIILQQKEEHSADLKKIYGLLNTMSQQLNLRQKMASTGEHVQVRVMKCPTDHSCLFHALKIIADKLKNPNAAISVSDSQAKSARALMLYQAKLMWTHDRERWNTFFEKESYTQFYARHSKNPCTDNWGGSQEIALFAKEFEGLEIREVYADGKSAPAIRSPASECQVISKVAFVIWNGGHYDIGAAKMEANAVNKVIFNPDEAARVQPLLLDHVAGKGTMVNSAPQQSKPNPDPQQSKEDFLKQAQMDLSYEGDVDWTVVETEDRRQRQARKKKEKEKKEKEEQEQKEKEAKEKKEKENEARQAAMIAQQELMLRTAQEQTVRMQQALQGQQTQQAPTLMAQQATSFTAQQQQQPAWIPQQQQHFQHHSPPASYAQVLQQARQLPIQPPAANGEFDIILGGSPVLPAVVIFTKETVPRVEAMMRKVAPAAASLVKSAVKRGEGTDGERCELHCLQKDIPNVQAAVGLLRSNGVRADIYKDQQQRRSGTGGLASQATTGMEEAIRRAGVCRQYYYRQTCTRGPSCKFKCYGSHLPQYPASPY